MLAYCVHARVQKHVVMWHCQEKIRVIEPTSALPLESMCDLIIIKGVARKEKRKVTAYLQHKQPGRIFLPSRQDIEKA